jgi:two-component system, sensor histidine kinase and response regulator
MSPVLRYKTRLWARRLDGFLESKVNRILPKSLTKRYVLALGCVAFIVFITQLLEQLSFHLQYRGFSQVRLIEEQNGLSLEFSRLVQQLRYHARQEMILERLEIAERSFRKLRENQEKISGEDGFVYYTIGNRSSLDVYFDLTSNSIQAMAGQLKGLRQTAEARRRLAPFADELLKSEHAYRSNLTELMRFYESRIDSRIRKVRVLGMLVTLLVITLLAFLGLYVIRPAVRQLFEAVDARSKFVGRMGNEIRNPMNSILGMTRLLGDTKLTEQQRHYISVLSSSSNSLMSLLNNLIDYSKISSGKVMLEYCEIDLLNSVQDCIDLVAYKADRKELDLLLSVDPQTSLRVTTDPLLLQQILLNLLENSVKFTERGKIVLSIWQTRDFGRSRLHFSITDTGIGINADKLSEIFEYFQQEDPSILRKYGGSGLGLGICLELVKLTGGQIDVQSQKGKGSAFHFFLPVNRFSEETFEDIFNRQAMKGKRAFVMENNHDRRSKLCSYIKFYGGEAVTVEGGESNRGEEFWVSYFQENRFDVYVINYEHYSKLIGYLQAAQERIEENLLGKVAVLLRSTLPSSRIMRLNSIGVKTFCYIPVKPIEFLGAIDLALKNPPRPQLRSPAEEKMAQFELARPISALVVDDSRDNQFLMKSYLEKHSSHMVIADNGAEALEKFKQNSFDIVFMDLLMPELDGYEAARQMRAWEAAQGKPGVPIVAVSAHTGEEEVEKCRISGFTAHLSKPLDLGELQAFMGKVFGEKVSSNNSQPKPESRHEEADKAWQTKLKEYLPNYYRQRGEDLRNLRSAVDTSDWSRLVFIGHKIKGSAATYGFPELGQAGAELEKFAQEKDLPEVNNRINYIEQWLKSVSP